MTEPVKRYYITESAVVPMLDNQVTYTPLVNHKTDVHVIPLVMAADYARLEQECERWKETAAGLDRQNDAIADEVAGAIKRAERLRGLLMEISKSEGRGVDWAQEIDAALSAKP